MSFLRTPGRVGPAGGLVLVGATMPTDLCGALMHVHATYDILSTEELSSMALTFEGIRPFRKREAFRFGQVSHLDELA